MLVVSFGAFRISAAPKRLPLGEGGLAKRGRMRVGEHYRSASHFVTAPRPSSAPVCALGHLPPGEGISGASPCKTISETKRHSHPKRLGREYRTYFVVPPKFEELRSSSLPQLSGRRPAISRSSLIRPLDGCPSRVCPQKSFSRGFPLCPGVLCVTASVSSRI